MKNLKIRLGLFCFLAVLAVSVFLTSCEQEELIDSEFILFYGYDELSEEEKEEYVDSLAPELVERCYNWR